MSVEMLQSQLRAKEIQIKNLKDGSLIHLRVLGEIEDLKYKIANHETIKNYKFPERKH